MSFPSCILILDFISRVGNFEISSFQGCDRMCLMLRTPLRVATYHLVDHFVDHSMTRKTSLLWAQS